MKAKRSLMRVFLALNLVVWILLLSVSTAEAAPPQQGGIIYHTVVRGETLAKIAARYGTTVSAIMQQNHISNPNRIYVGQRLAIPTASAAPPAASSGSPPPAPVPSGSPATDCAYLIAWGDTLAKIAARYGTTPGWLMSANGLSSGYIVAGRTLRVPCSGGQTAPAPVSPSMAPSPTPQVSQGVSGASYRVRSGDTLSSIALLYHTTVQAIMAANGLTNPNHIYVGQVLHIPLQ